MNRFQNQVAIVTGGARGIGQGVAHRLASEGCQVILFDILEKELQTTLDQFEKEGFSVTGQLLDITNEERVNTAIEQVEQTYNQIDILVNCAGIVGPTSIKIADYSSANFDQVMKVNLKGAFLLTKYVISVMSKRDYGRILHISSIGGKEGNPGMVGYAASKSALMGLVKGVGKEYAASGITINGLAPAVIATKMNESTHPEMLQYMIDKIPMKRLGTIAEVSAICCWIVSKEASFNTACIFDLSGGRATY